MKKLLLFLCCACSLPLMAQKPGKADQKAMSLLEQSMDAMRVYEYNDAVKFLKEAIQVKPDFPDAYGQLGLTYIAMKQYSSAIEAFTQLEKLDPDGARSIRPSHARAFAGNGQFKEALAMLTDYMQTARNPSPKAVQLKKNMEFAVTTQAVPFQPQNLGDQINSPDPEYFPSPTIDGKTLVYTRRVRGRDEDFYIADRDSLQWNASRDMGEPINTAFNEGAQNISQDGEMLVFTGCDFPNGRGSCDIYYAIKTPQGWQPPKNIGPAINTEVWESQPCLSPDKQTLYFARQTQDAGADIFVSTRNAAGQWMPAERLGPQINTKGRETTPFLHADGQTLFFASDGHPGFGGLDIFYSRKQADGSWGPAVNLGYPINTIEEEGSLTVAADGKTAYYASDRSDSKGSLDIYSFELYESARPMPTLYLKGYVYDVKTNQRLAASLDLIDLQTKLTIATIRANDSGDYLVPLPVGKDYAFSVNRKGYLFYSENFSLKETQNGQPFEKNIPLTPLEPNAVAVLRNIFFPSNQFTLDPASATELDKLVALLKDNPTMVAEISGHTDNVGSDAANQQLSENRAKSVVEYLVQHGIPAQRLKAKGYGETKAIDNNDTETGRAQNRRTELKVISL
ncbi:OmpA family protein [Chitinophaga sp. GCM10012297]|uniref:PD40 domain-containing protein n=1 Tax=Chitinophaga chungangae TaxID=2821488 RepID=A0ABS3Y7Q6_9BACT|nr:OmpA family protein [Chitinophaga chungangae]MBO9150656.1 PD40 domain-containing protein [Chitinophaga chungangae]